MSTLTLITGRPLPSDQEIKVVASHDPRRAADLVVRKYRDGLFRHAAGILKDYEEAIDVTQEVFIRAFREPRFYADEFKMKAWLYRVTTNLCFNFVRNRKRRSAILDAEPLASASDPGQLDVVFQSQQQDTILEAMDRLTEEHRKILMLRYYSDLSYNEIADALEVKLGTVMSRLSRAKRRLVEAMDEVEGSDRAQEV